MPKSLDPEHIRLHEDETRQENWKRWGPYLSERQWGTVREVCLCFSFLLLIVKFLIV
jgi:hypothetical protein